MPDSSVNLKIGAKTLHAEKTSPAPARRGLDFAAAPDTLYVVLYAPRPKTPHTIEVWP